MTESKLIRLELGDLVRLSKCPTRLCEYCGELFVQDSYNAWQSISDPESRLVYDHMLVRPAKLCELPAVKVDGVVE